MIRLFAMPDDHEAMPAWLDGQLLGPHLRELTAELRVAHRPGPKPSLEAVLGAHRAAFLSGGFGVLPRQVLRLLLRNPDLLDELREVVYAEGGEFWFAGALSAEEQSRARRVVDRVRESLRAEPRRPVRSRRWLSHIGVSIATAAGVLVAVWIGGGFRSSPQAAPGWGFAKIQQVQRGEPKSTFTELAALADEWGNKPPADRDALAKRLSEFRLGCSQLQAADLGLPPDDTRWLKARCFDWSAAIDRHLRILDETGDTAGVLAAATATIKGIAAELRERAG